MKIKLDENIPAALKPLLAGLGHRVDTVPEEGLAGATDSDVWTAAQQADAFLITQDLDFSDLRQFQPGTHRGILLVRLRAPGRTALTERLRTVFEYEKVAEWARCFIVVSERKIRIRRPPPA
jgi:predicted nuclease of predicted toxin-antitoxin system